MKDFKEIKIMIKEYKKINNITGEKTNEIMITKKINKKLI